MLQLERKLEEALIRILEDYNYYDVDLYPEYFDQLYDDAVLSDLAQYYYDTERDRASEPSFDLRAFYDYYYNTRNDDASAQASAAGQQLNVNNVDDAA